MMILALLGFIVVCCIDPKLFSRIESHLCFHPQDKAVPYCFELFMMAGNSTVINESCATPSTQEIFSSSDVETDDIFLTVQRSTKAICLIYNDLLAKAKNDFIAELSEYSSVSELRYVRDMVYSLVKRKLNHKNIGHLCERRSGPNVKENLVKDIYNLYSLGEESIQSLPQSMLKPDSKNRHQESQIDSVLCKTLFVSKSELDDLRTEPLFKLSELKEEVKTHTYPRCQPPNLALTSPCISSPHSTPVAADLQASR